MMQNIRNISAKITLSVYLAGMLVSALFHHHEIAERFVDGDIVISVPSEQADWGGVKAIDHCSLCKVAGAQKVASHHFVVVIPQSIDQIVIISRVILKDLVLGSLSQRAPPLVV